MANCSCKKCKRCTDNWYSRRNQTRDAQDAAREKYQAERGPEARRRRAKRREDIRKVREAGERTVHEYGDALERLAE